MNIRQVTYSPEPEKNYIFEPQEDITAYEVAELFPLLTAAWVNKKDAYQLQGVEVPSWMNSKVENLPDSLRRHFRLRG